MQWRFYIKETHADGWWFWKSLCVAFDNEALGILDVEEMPDTVTCIAEASAYAAKRWNVPESEVKFKCVQLVEVEE